MPSLSRRTVREILPVNGVPCSITFSWVKEYLRGKTGLSIFLTARGGPPVPPAGRAMIKSDALGSVLAFSFGSTVIVPLICADVEGIAALEVAALLEGDF